MQQEDNWSGDQYFLDNINTCIRVYGESLIGGDLKRMYEIVEFFETITSPAIENDDVEKNLKEIDRLMPYCYVVDEKGHTIGENQANVRIVRKRIKETFRLILLKLEAKGIYRHKAKDPRHAMSNFGSS